MATYMTNTNVTNVEQGYNSQPAVRRGNAGRKKSKKEQKKKEPQRGMGVEKLERMRVQEILKNPGFNNNNDPKLFNAFQFSNFGGFSNGLMGVSGVGAGSNEAYSNRNVGFKYPSQYCTPSFCNKKMRYDGGYSGGLMVGSSVGANNMVNQRLLHGYAVQPGVEVKAVHNKGASSSQESENLVMEYEFFPKDPRKDKLVMMDENVVAQTFDEEEEITTCLGIGVPGFDNSLDLSLKLSY